MNARTRARIARETSATLAETIAYEIDELAARRGGGLDDVAACLRVSRQTLHKWTTGERRPRLDALVLLSVLSGRSVDELLGMKAIREEFGP